MDISNICIVLVQKIICIYIIFYGYGMDMNTNN
jgi:hypothetical protein